MNFDICVIMANDGAPYDWPDVEGYETRCVSHEEFKRRLLPELDVGDMDWPFLRGDRCAASFCSDEIVGYSFDSTQNTKIDDHLEFIVPGDYVYGYKSFTAPAHRGGRLEPDRWKALRRHRIQMLGKDPRVIFYISVMNLESLAANKAASPITLGYAAYIELFRRRFVFNSPKSKRNRTGFAVTS